MVLCAWLGLVRMYTEQFSNLWELHGLWRLETDTDQ